MFKRSKVGDRRAAHRYEAVGTIALGWRAGSDFRTISANLLDISQNGARLSAANAPRRNATAWLLVNDRRSELWLRSTVVDVSKGWYGPYTVRVRFDEPCPYDFLRASIRGMNIQELEPASGPEEFLDHHFWR